jgi:REP element-mobilizing transposase RayT
MAKKWSNKNLPGALHYVTANIFNRKPVFRNDNACKIFLEELQHLRSAHECKLISFVVMPDHCHFVLNPRNGNIQESTGALKSTSAKRLIENAPPKLFWNGAENQVWQESFKAMPLWSDWMIWQKINYIHANPIRANLVKSTEDHRWSSFHAFYRNETDPLLQIDKEWWWPDDVDKLRRAMAEWNKESEENQERG